MDVNQVRFGNYSIGNNGAGKKSEGRNEEETSKDVLSFEANTKNVDANIVFDALKAQGLQNQTQITFISKKEVDPVAFLGKERVSDIEEMMARFEQGVNMVSDTIETEFPGAFTVADKNALAAQIYAEF